MDIFGLIALAKSSGGSAFNFKGKVTSVNQLPILGKKGDVYRVDDTNKYYAWNGDNWIDIGQLTAIDGIRGITSWTLTQTDEDKDIYTVTYTDGTTTTITVQNSKYWHDEAEVVYDNTRALLLNTIVVYENTTATEVTLTPDNGARYIYGELLSLTINSVPDNGMVDIIFESGTTPTVLVLPQSGVTLPEWFDPTDLQASTRYELNFADGNLLMSSWPIS